MQRVKLVAALAICCCATLFYAPARGGTLVTRGGQSLSGKIELKAGSTISVTPEGKSAVIVAIKDVSRLSMTDDAPPATGQAADPQLPAPWRQQDIGRVKKEGGGKEEHGVFTLQGAGWGIWGGKDSFHFVHQPLSGDVELIAHIATASTSDAGFTAGLTIRAGFEPDSVETSIMIYPEGAPRMNMRPKPAATGKPSEARQQTWVRLYRTGDTLASFSSRDGKTWTPVGSVETKMKGTLYGGLACAGIANQELVSVTFDSVSVRPAERCPNAGVGLVDGSVVAGTAKDYDGTTLKYTDAAGAEHGLAGEKVAYIFTRPMPADIRGALPGGNSGICLLNGDTIEGEITKLADGKFTLTSVVSGLQAPEYSQVLSAVFRPAKVEGAFSVSTRDGARYQCDQLTAEDGVLYLTSKVLGPVALKEADLARITAAKAVTGQSN